MTLFLWVSFGLGCLLGAVVFFWITWDRWRSRRFDTPEFWRDG